MNRGVAIVLGSILGVITLMVGEALVLAHYIRHQDAAQALMIDPKDPPPVALCDKDTQTCFIPVVVQGEARDHPQEVFNAVREFKQTNPSIVISWPLVFAKQAVYVHWDCGGKTQHD